MPAIFQQTIIRQAQKKSSQTLLMFSTLSSSSSPQANGTGLPYAGPLCQSLLYIVVCPVGDLKGGSEDAIALVDPPASLYIP